MSSQETSTLFAKPKVFSTQAFANHPLPNHDQDLCPIRRTQPPEAFSDSDFDTSDGGLFVPLKSNHSSDDDDGLFVPLNSNHSDEDDDGLFVPLNSNHSDEDDDGLFVPLNSNHSDEDDVGLFVPPKSTHSNDDDDDADDENEGEAARKPKNKGKERARATINYQRSLSSTRPGTESPPTHRHRARRDSDSSNPSDNPLHDSDLSDSFSEDPDASKPTPPVSGQSTGQAHATPITGTQRSRRPDTSTPRAEGVPLTSIPSHHWKEDTLGLTFSSFGVKLPTKARPQRESRREKRARLLGLSGRLTFNNATATRPLNRIERRLEFREMKARQDRIARGEEEDPGIEVVNILGNNGQLGGKMKRVLPAGAMRQKRKYVWKRQGPNGGRPLPKPQKGKETGSEQAKERV
ncbi:hypothetical protein B7494_g1308 [Chlorociboria aeruginascens]|nr:hypothetical protein B7494_g1308 [Chlorociboria aeruginascens]